MTSFKEPGLTEDYFSHIDLTAEIVSSYVSHNSVPPSELLQLISTVHAALRSLGSEPKVEAQPLVPAVPIKKSVTPDWIISLEDGRKFKSIRRHLKAAYGMTPDEYRNKWGLPHDYPMVAPNSSEARSAIAKARDFGRKKGVVVEARASPAKRRGRALEGL
jgi:predicted transcriptional regulator